MKQIKAVFFDQGNVLDDYRQQNIAMAERLGITYNDFQRYAAPYVRSVHLGMDEIEFLRRVCSDAGAIPPSKPIFRETFEEHRIFNYELLDVNTQLRELGL